MMTPKIQAVDLSHWNEVTDWQAMKKSGVVGAIHKATEGVDYVDPMYSFRRDQAIGAGLLWGAYHFLQPNDDMDGIDAQMEHFFGEVAPWDGMRLVVDYEVAGSTLKMLKRALQTLQKMSPKGQLAIYGGSLLKEQLGDSNDSYLGSFSLWIAQYNTSPTWPKGTWPILSLWQYSDGTNGPEPKVVAGVSGACDCNVFNGSDAQLKAWFGTPGFAPAPKPEPNYATVQVLHGAGIIVENAVDTSLDNEAFKVEYFPR